MTPPSAHGGSAPQYVVQEDLRDLKSELIVAIDTRYMDLARQVSSAETRITARLDKINGTVTTNSLAIATHQSWLDTLDKEVTRARQRIHDLIAKVESILTSGGDGALVRRYDLVWIGAIAAGASGTTLAILRISGVLG